MNTDTTNEPIDFSKYFSQVDFDSKKIKEEILEVAEEILSVMEGEKVDPSKMLNTFYMNIVAARFVQELPKAGFWKTFPNKIDFFKAGIIYGLIAATPPLDG